MKLYRISHWEKLYEVPEAKRRDGPLAWVALPTKLDSFGFRRVAMQRERSDLFSAWVLMLEVAARQPRKWRGALVRDGVPLTAEHLATITGWPAAAFSQAFEFFTDPEQGWLTVENIPDAAASSPEIEKSAAPAGPQSPLQHACDTDAASRSTSSSSVGASEAAHESAEVVGADLPVRVWLPFTLDVPKFWPVFAKFCTYLSGPDRHPICHHSVAHQVRLLVEITKEEGLDAAIEAVEFAIKNNLHCPVRATRSSLPDDPSEPVPTGA
jgi:hypothetical protein